MAEEPEIPSAFQNAPVVEGKGLPAAWMVAFVFFPYGPFLYLAILRAIRWPRAIFFIVISATLVNGLVSVLIKTNGQPVQFWIILLLNALCFCFGLLQYAAGERGRVWSPLGRRLWIGAGWLLGVMLALDLLGQIVRFQLNGRL